MRSLLFGAFVFSISAVVVPALSIAAAYRVVEERGLWDSKTYVVKCENGKERTITQDKKTGLYWYAWVGQGDGWKTLDAAAKDICEKT